MLEGSQVPTEYSVRMSSGWKLAAVIDKSVNSWGWNIDKQQADRFLQCKVMRDETLDYQSRQTGFLKVVLLDSKTGLEFRGNISCIFGRLEEQKSGSKILCLLSKTDWRGRNSYTGKYSKIGMQSRSWINYLTRWLYAHDSDIFIMLIKSNFP